MGICIAYSGKLREPGLVAEFVRDLGARAEAVGWPHKIMSELVAEGVVDCEGLEGITLYPHRACEPLHFHFDKDGTFVNHFYYTLLGNTEKARMIRQALAESMAFTRELSANSKPKAKPKAGGRRRAGRGSGPQVRVGIPELPEPEALPLEGGVRYNWTKTQFAGAKVHTAVCAILRYVQQRYAPDLEITDDSGYFVDGDYEKLETQLAYVDYLVSVTSQAVEATAASGTGPMTLEAFVNRLEAELAEAKNKLH